MIDAKDLMIGNWVMSTHPAMPRPIKVTEIGKNDIGYNNGILSISYIEPITITPEILEKNGFKKNGESYFLFHDFYDLEVKEESDGMWLVALDDCEFNLPRSQVLVSHVHQLQHALQLFGTGKEIEL